MTIFFFLFLTAYVSTNVDVENPPDYDSFVKRDRMNGIGSYSTLSIHFVFLLVWGTFG